MPDHPLPDAARAKERWAAMLLMRRFEERSRALYEKGAIAGFLHSGAGEEATIVGGLRALDAHDAVLSTFRAHAHALVRGTPPGEVMAELMGRVGGVSGGRGGSTHVVDPARGVLGGWGIPGGHAPVAAGVALARRASGGVVLCQLPMGATAQGVVSEAWSLCAAWELPAVFLVTHDTGAAPPVTELFARSAALGVAGLRCDGMDVLAVEVVVGEAVRRAREQQRPTVVEALVRRPPAGDWAALDPVATFAARLEREGAMDVAQRAGIEDSVREQVDAAVAFAEASPEPDPSTLLDHVVAR
ncbi:MAG TPA: thiamine pyrophosphate-dependent enzyme [Baekduia sp.]|nr:thiamine pyrophosphate-dependent enzyme [Baekduia sp.]